MATKLFTALAVTVLLLVPELAAAQQPPADEVREILEQYEEAVAAAQEIENRLEPVRQGALQRSASLQQRAADLQEALDQAYRDRDSDYDQRLARARALHEEAVAAQDRGDHGRMQRLEREAEELRHYFESLHLDALSDPALGADLDAYRAELVGAMTELDAEAPSLLGELDRINADIDSLRGDLTAALGPDRD